MPTGIYQRKKGLKRKPRSIEIKEKIKNALIGRKRPDVLNNPQIFKKGHIPWNKDRKMTLEHKQKLKKPHLKSRGINHYRWKGGITSLYQKIRMSDQYKKWTFNIYKRDNFICQICFIKCQSKNIVAHHLQSFSEFPELRFSVDNGITLCRSCHLKVHNGKICLN